MKLQRTPWIGAAIVALVAERPLPPDDYARRVRVHDELVHVTIEPHPA